MPLRLIKHPLARHGVRFCVDVVAVVMGIITILLVALGWRLSTGPIILNDLTPMLVQALSPPDARLHVEIGETVLSWNTQRRGLDLAAHRLRVADADNRVIASVPEVAMRFSLGSVIALSPRPTRLILVQPFLKIRRWPDGHLSLALADQPTGAPETDDNPVTLESLIAMLEGKADGVNPLAHLRMLEIAEGRLLVDDQLTQRQWLASKLAINIRRNDDGLLATGDLLATLPGGDVPISAKIHLAADDDKGAATFTLGPVAPSRLAEIDPLLAPLQALTMPVRVEAEAGFRKNGQWDNARLNLEAGAGTLALADLYDTPLAIDHLTARLRADLSVKTVWLDHLELQTEGTTLTAKGQAQRIDNQDRLTLDLTAGVMSSEKLVKIWPIAAATNGRLWVKDHLSGGLVENASVSVDLLAPTGQPQVATLQRLDGQFTVKDVNVLYHPALPPVEKANGHGTLTAQGLVFDNLSGKSRDLEIAKATLKIDGFDRDDQNLVIEGDAKGPLRTILTALNHPRFGYAKQLGLDPADVSGVTEAHFRFALPLLAVLDIADVDMNVAGKVTALNIDNAVAGLPLSGGNLAITLNNKRMLARGRTDIAGMPLDVDWQQSFLKKDKVTSRIAFKGTADASILGGFAGLDQAFLQGNIGLEGEYRELRDKGADLTLNADVSQSSLIWPDGLAPINPLQAEGRVLRVKANRAANKLWVVPQLALDGKNVAIIGRAYQGATGGTEIILDQFRLGATDVGVNWKQAGNGAVTLAISGRVLDLDPWLKTPADAVIENEPAGEPTDEPDNSTGPLDDALGFPLSLSIMVDQMRMGGSISWQQVAAQLTNDGERWQRLQIGAKIDVSAFQLRHRGDGADDRLIIHAEDLGKFLASVDIENSIRSGQADIIADVKGNAVTGTATVTDAFIVDAPALMRLFSVLSTQGLSALDGQTGVRFSTTETRFTWRRGRLLLKDGRANGAQIGITFGGKIDLGASSARQIDIEGTIIPVYTLNRLIGAIPILGTLLTGGEGEGLFAATYSMKGPRSDPAVTVNPLAALAPGIVRRILFMGDVPGQETPETPAPPAPDENPRQAK